MSTMAAVLRLLLVACAALAALAQETRSLRIGVVAQNARPMFYGVPGSGWEGFEVAVRTQMCSAASISCTVVELASLEDRIPALQNGTVDAVLARFSVTPERRTQVTFVNPFYYAAGGELFTLNSSLPNFPNGWADIAGKPVCLQSGYYAAGYIETTYTPTLVFQPNTSAVVNGVVSGQCVAAVFDSSQVFDRLVPVETAAPVELQPYAVALSLNHTVSAYNSISSGLTQLMKDGNASQILYDEALYVSRNNGVEIPALNETVYSISFFV